MGSTEVAETLKVSRSRVTELVRSNRDFPRPLVVLRAGPVFCGVEIHEFLRTWTRKSGPKPKK
jgi:hypothetical protein